MPKLRFEIVTIDFLRGRSKACRKGGWMKPRWIDFCEALLPRYRLRLYEARNTASKYIYVSSPGSGRREYKVRFSNHKPSLGAELARDCDFYVGHSNLDITNWKQAIEAVNKHFGATDATTLSQ